MVDNILLSEAQIKQAHDEAVSQVNKLTKEQVYNLGKQEEKIHIQNRNTQLTLSILSLVVFITMLIVSILFINNPMIGFFIILTFITFILSIITLINLINEKKIINKNKKNYQIWAILNIEKKS